MFEVKPWCVRPLQEIEYNDRHTSTSDKQASLLSLKKGSNWTGLDWLDILSFMVIHFHKMDITILQSSFSRVMENKHFEHVLVCCGTKDMQAVSKHKQLVAVQLESS